MKTCDQAKLLLICLMSLLCASSCDKKDNSTQREITPKGYNDSESTGCGFRTSGFSGTACKVPYVAVLANPQKYNNKRIFTYAYMLKEHDGLKFTFLLEPKIRASPDLASCVQFESQNPQDEMRLSDLKYGVVYAVSFAGTFIATADYMCAGKLENLDFQDIAVEKN